MRVKRGGNVTAPRVRAEHQAADARAVAELRARVRRAIVLPLFNLWRSDVIVPAAPIVPRDEDRRVVPLAALNVCIDLVRCPLRAQRHIADVLALVLRIGRVLAEFVRRVNPGHCR